MYTCTKQWTKHKYDTYSIKRQPLNYRLLTWDKHALSHSYPGWFFFFQKLYGGGINIPLFKHQTKVPYWLPQLWIHQTRYFISEKQAKYALLINFRIHSYIYVSFRIVSQYVFYKDPQSSTFHLTPYWLKYILHRSIFTLIRRNYFVLNMYYFLIRSFCQQYRILSGAKPSASPVKRILKEFTPTQTLLGK